MRFRLDPLSPTGVSIAPEATVVKQSNGFVTNNIRGLISAGSNVTIAGNGTESSPYEIAAGDMDTAATWGNVTGTLSDQTDLQTALDGKAATTHDHSLLYRQSDGHPFMPLRNVVTNFNTGHGWTKVGTAGTVADDTANYAKGGQSISVVTDGAMNYSTIRSTAATALDLSTKVITITLKITNITNLERIALFAFSGSTSNSYIWTFQRGTDTFPPILEGQWTTLTLSFTDASTSGSPTRNNITQWQFQMRDNAGGTMTVNINELGYVDDGSSLFPNGCLVVTFDDGYDSQYTNARPVLDQYGINPTTFVIRDRLGQSGYMTEAQLAQVHKVNGWEVAAHSDTLSGHNTNFVATYSTGEAALVSELEGIKSWLLENGYHSGADYLAYPNGAYDANVLSVVRRYFTSARTIYGSLKETIPAGDNHAVRAVSGISSLGVTAPTIQSRIDSAVANKDALVLVFHRITTGTAITTNECSVADFETIISHAKNSGIAIVTYGEMIRRLNDNDAPALNGKASSSHTHEISDTTGLQTALDSKVDENTAITGDTKTKITYDAKGLVTSGADATQDDIGDGTTYKQYSATEQTKLDGIEAGAEVNRAVQPSEHGLVAWNYDPSGVNGSSVALSTAGLMYVQKIYVRAPITVANVEAYVVTAGSTLTAGQCFAALYQNGSLLGVTADQSANWTSTGQKTMALTGAPFAVSAGHVYVGFWFNGTTGPALFRTGGTSAMINYNLATTESRYGAADSGLTTTAPSTLGTIGRASVAYWTGLS